MAHGSVTPLYAALLTILFLVLSARVISQRRVGKIPLGTAGDPALERVARVHANFAEYTPLALLAIFFVEDLGYGAWIVHALGILLLAGRLAHAFGVSRAPEDYRLRAAGMGMTFTVLGLSAALLLLRSLFGPIGI